MAAGSISPTAGAATSLTSDVTLAPSSPVSLPGEADSVTLGSMACLAVLLALISPRLALFFIFLFSDLLSDAFDSWLLPLLGFFLLPWTTLAYAGMWAAGSNTVNGFEWFVVVLAFVVDLGSYAGGSRARD